jgi:hypothetical protein
MSEVQRLAPLLEGVHAAVVSAGDPAYCARVALEIARTHTATRRVVVIDMIGNTAPMRALLGADNHGHGIAECLLYGLSLDQVVRALPEDAQLYLIPSGAEPVAQESMYRHDRWRRLAAGFASAEALLLVIATRETIGFSALCDSLGTVLMVGDSAPPAAVGSARVLWSPPPLPSPDALRQLREAQQSASVTGAQRSKRSIALVLLTAALLVGAVAAWPLIRPYLAQYAPATLFWEQFLSPNPAAAQGDSSGGDSLAVAEGSRATDSLVLEPLPALADEDTAPLTAGAPLLEIANPQDALQGAPFAVYLVSANTREEATVSAEIAAAAGASALSPVRTPTGGSRWFQSTVGAGSDSAQAVALLRSLRDARLVGPTSGSIIRVPFALRLAEDIGADSAATVVARWSARGVSAYGLRQLNGDVSIFTGAFQTPAQATLLADSLRTLGVTPTLVYRTGRVF